MHCLFGPQTITWDGIATESAALADSPAVFTEGSAPFHRALPAVVSGEPVPPPYYTLFFRYREADSDTAPVIDETSTTVYVPQVVKIEMADAAFEEFKRPILHPGTYYPDLLGDPEVAGCESNILIYAGSPTTSMSQLLSTVANKCAFQYPTTVNMRLFLPSRTERHRETQQFMWMSFGGLLQPPFSQCPCLHCKPRNRA